VGCKTTTQLVRSAGHTGYRAVWCVDGWLVGGCVGQWMGGLFWVSGQCDSVLCLRDSQSLYLLLRPKSQTLV